MSVAGSTTRITAPPTVPDSTRSISISMNTVGADPALPPCAGGNGTDEMRPVARASTAALETLANSSRVLNSASRGPVSVMWGAGWPLDAESSPTVVLPQANIDTTKANKAKVRSGILTTDRRPLSVRMSYAAALPARDVPHSNLPIDVDSSTVTMGDGA